MRKIFVGNKNGRGFDVMIEESRKVYFYRVGKDMGYDTVTISMPVEMVNKREISWEELHKDVQDIHMCVLHGD